MQKGMSSFTPPLANYGSANARNGGCICMDCNQPCGPGNLLPANRNLVL